MNSSLFEECYRIAVKELPTHTADAFRHWSFIIQNGKVVEWGKNRLSDPARYLKLGYRNNRHSIHAEAVAMRKAYGKIDRRKPWDLINIRLTADGVLRMAAPCSICYSFAKACNCRSVHFSTDLEKFAKITY